MSGPDFVGRNPVVCAEAQKLLLTFKPDVIVSDIGLPQKDGYEFIRDVRKQGFDDAGGGPQHIRAGRRPHPLGLI